MSSSKQEIIQPAFEEGRYELVAALFLRLLALIYLAAFVSLTVQIEGLVGSGGILPLSDYLQSLRGDYGVQAWRLFPSLFWLYGGDIALTGAGVLGIVLSVMLFLQLWPRLCLALLFVLYLSLATAAQIFLNFQWDYLLLEAGAIALFLANRQTLAVWLFRWLLFRLRFLSGASKLLSQDPSWTNLMAVAFYFEVQPLPNPLSWYAHQLPEAVLRAGSALTLFVELLVPFMMFLPRRWRFIAAWLTIAMQLLILLTSNHNWFNLLTLVLCLFLFDDKALARALPVRITDWLMHRPLPQAGVMHKRLTLTFAVWVISVSLLQMWTMFTGQRIDGVLGEVVTQTAQLRIANKYHVFPTMKTERFELIVSGSVDGRDWKVYPMRYAPQDLATVPPLVVPHQPRLDWMVWFVTIHPNFVPWYRQFLQGLLENRPAVTGLLAENPFAGAPPRYLRVDVYRYRFTSFEEHRQSGHWWKRDYLGPFTPLPGLQRLDGPPPAKKPAIQ